MRALIGFNLIAFAISVIIILLMYDGNIKEKAIFIVLEPIFMGMLTIGVYLAV